ncbi:hypothetical protein EC968_005985 [Mortierella alpina]|nr:hypothetical protein EC968_005985 [Mortierella alpina]
MSQHTIAMLFWIPELAIQVTDQLDNSDLVVCVQANRAWHDFIIPFLYRNVIVGERHGLKSFDKDCWAGFQKHSAHMRVLDIDSRAECDISLFGSNCTHLVALHLEHCDFPRKDASWSWGLLKLVSHNPNISTLYLTTSRSPKSSRMLYHCLVELRLLRYLPGLKKLVITNYDLGYYEIYEIMRCAHRLEELDVKVARVDQHILLGPRRPHPVFDCASTRRELSLKEYEADNDTQTGPCIVDSQGVRCRRGTRLKKFRFVLVNDFYYGDVAADALQLLRLCCSAEYIQLDIREPHRGKVVRVLRDQVGHHAWCLKHLDIGGLRAVDVPGLVEILRASRSSLLSFRLWKSSLTDELLLVLSEYHGKTLERVTFGKCPEIFHKDKIEALLSQCPHLQSLDVFNCEKEGDLHIAMTGKFQARRTSSDGRVFTVLTSDHIHLKLFMYGQVDQVPDIATDEGTVDDGLWRIVDMIRLGRIRDHVRFVADGAH